MASRLKFNVNLIFKCLLCSLMLGTPTVTIAKDQDVLYEQIDNDSLIGRLWLPSSSKQNPAILLIGGSGGGYENQDAKWLSAQGFVVLNVRFFGEKGLPENLVDIPIEYFNSAVHWLNSHKSVKKGAIGLFGHSKGTEAAILTAYGDPLIKAVVVRSPSSIVWAGPGWSGFNESSWSRQREPINFHSVGLRDGAVWLSRVLRNKKLIQTRAMFENALLDKDSVELARLPVEHIKANLLLLSGSDDQQWPSRAMANMLVTILDASEFEFDYKHVVFADAGHRPGRSSHPNDTFANGGTETGNAEAHKRTKVLVKDFFDKSLR